MRDSLEEISLIDVPFRIDLPIGNFSRGCHTQHIPCVSGPGRDTFCVSIHPLLCSGRFCLINVRQVL